MKYNEVFKDGMPLEIYQMKEEDRLKLNFIIDKDGFIIMKKQKVENKFLLFFGKLLAFVKNKWRHYEHG